MVLEVVLVVLEVVLQLLLLQLLLLQLRVLLKLPSPLGGGVLSNIKLQTARFSTLEQLQGRDPHRKMRIDELYLPMGVLGVKNARKQRKIVKNCFFLNFFS